MKSVVELLRDRARAEPNHEIYTFLRDGENDRATLTCAQLDQQARSVAATLQRFLQPGARALLLFPSSLEFIAAFFGCLYSGVVAVPSAPIEGARPQRALARL